LRVINETSFEFGAFANRLSYPGHSLTVIVKGTFDLVPDGSAVIAKQQLPLCGDEPFADSDPASGSIRYESDLVEYKQATDLLLVGSCHAPEGRPVRSCKVTFRVGDTGHTLRVTGDREWITRGLLRRRDVSDARPFASMPLRYEQAYGGPGYAQNPVGKGASAGELPNIEDLADPVTSPKSTPAPAGFSPLNRCWRDRTSKIGSYDETYVKARWPREPEDFDRACCNAAPPALQARRFLRGDEEILLENLHPDRPNYSCALPGKQARCFLQDDESFREITLRLDTLWIDAEAEQLVLVWRGSTEVSSNEYEEVRNLLIVDEALTDERDEAAYRELLEQLVPPTTATAQVAAVAAETERLTREQVEQHIAAGDSLNGSNLEGLELSGMALPGVNLEGARLAGASFDRADLTGATFSGADLTGASLRDAELSGADFTRADLTRATLDRANLRDAVLYRAILREASLRQANLFRGILEQADARDADFSEANLYEAYFVDALTGGARADRANLTHTIRFRG